MRVFIALAMVAATPSFAQQVDCSELLNLHQQALKSAEVAQMAGVALLVMPYSIAVSDEAAGALSDIGNDLSGSWAPYLERFNEIALNAGCITPTE